jgi:PIN domain nuclease of toxin-antitoxin system
VNAAGQGVLLDTCAVIWVANAQSMNGEAREAIHRAGLAKAVFISVVSAWEIGLLASSHRGGRPRLELEPNPREWFERLLRRSAIKLAPLTVSAAFAASALPGPLYGDPADRLIMATAREMNLPVVTRDRKIIEYGESGFVKVIRC